MLLRTEMLHIGTILCKCRKIVNILIQSYNATVFYFDKISFLAHVLNQWFLLNGSSISQASHRIMDNGFNNLFPTVQETTHFMEVGWLKKNKTKQKKNKTKKKQKKKKHTHKNKKNKNKKQKRNAWWCTSIRHATRISCIVKDELISEILFGILDIFIR